MSAADESGRGILAEQDLAGVVDGFALGQVHQVAFLPSGMMNRNWRLERSPTFPWPRHAEA
ncbi:hypothetical protein [Nonomuraea typhae]|uniref:Uncharacterized protein n=1 Tax=Nonomuraea typhae TaxID=2603600 RepID=A0ABW7YVI3_9ACTN